MHMEERGPLHVRQHDKHLLAEADDMHGVPGQALECGGTDDVRVEDALEPASPPRWHQSVAEEPACPETPNDPWEWLGAQERTNGYIRVTPTV